jgi:hypothetical protein
MSKGSLVWAALIAGLMFACSSDEEELGLPDPSSGGGDRAAGLATAEEVAEAKRGDVDCPADIDSPPRAEGAPVDDVVGVRPGMTYEEAANVVLCSEDMLVLQEGGGRAFNIQTFGQTLRQGFTAGFAEREKSSDEIMKEMQQGFMERSGNAVTQDMLPGQSKWYVATMGMPGAERVIAVAREEWFDEGKNPTVESVTAALAGKYGTPARSIEQGHGQKVLAWIYDPLGRPVTETSPLFQQCIGISDPDGGTNFSPDCGLVVEARVAPLESNPQLASHVQVGVIDQMNGYQAITGTEQALLAADQQRKAAEVSQAAENADAPQL